MRKESISGELEHDDWRSICRNHSRRVGRSCASMDKSRTPRMGGNRIMTTLWCSHCGIPYKFTQEELTQLLIAGILYVDCLNCSNEIPLSSEPDSASS